jgi:hypothetical protein
MSMGRALAGLISLVAVVSLVLQFWVFVLLTREQGGHFGHAIWVFLSFFTILTNAIIALGCLFWARGHWPRRWPAAETTLGGLAMSIALVGAIYHSLLSKLWNPVGLHFVADQGLHTVVPLLFLVFWALYVPKSGLTLRHALVWLLYPAGYLVYALARGALDGWYPYPFLHAGQLGYVRVLINALALTACFYLAGLALVLVAKRLPPGQAP